MGTEATRDLNERARYIPIGAYAVIGDCRTTGFAALLDTDTGGRFRVRPVGSFRSARTYVPSTNVLETTCTTAGGACVLRDLMPVRSEEAKRSTQLPGHLVLRELDGLVGDVDLEVVYEPRPDYARRLPRLKPRGRLGLWSEIDGAACGLRSDVPLTGIDDGRAAVGTYCLRAGERRYLALGYGQEGPAVVPSLGAASSPSGEAVHRLVAAVGCPLHLSETIP